MRLINRTSLALLLAASAATVSAQTVTPDPLSKLVDDDLLGAIGPNNTNNITRRTFLLAIADAKARAAEPRESITAELSTMINRQRTDLQLGAPSNSPHTTSVLEKPGIADLLSLSLDRGAITKTETGTGLTLSTTPYAISTAFGLRDTPKRWDSAAVARNLSFSATFSSTDVTMGDFSSFTSGEVKYVIAGNRSPRDPALLHGVRENLGPIFRVADSAFDKACGGLQLTLKTETNALRAHNPEIKMSEWLKSRPAATVPEARKELDMLVSQTEVDTAGLNHCVDVILEGEQSISGGLEAVTNATKAYLAEHPHQFSIATLFVRDATLSDYYTAKLLYGYDVAPLTINLNAEVSRNKNSITTAGVPIRSLRDYSIEFGVNSKTLANGRLDYSVAAKAMRDKTLDAKSIVVSEAKLNIHLTDVLRLPIAVSYANRETETIKQGWQLNVGVSALLDDVMRSIK